MRDSTGVMTAKLIAEKDNPRADVIWGLAASSIGLMGTHGHARALHAGRRGGAEADVQERQEPRDLGRHGRLSRRRLLQHRRGGKKNKKPKPASWADLTKPEYKDSIVMPNPASSGTGYLTVAAWLQHHGRGGGLEVHGRAAPEHRAVHPFRLGALRAGRQGRAPDRHRLRHARRHGEDQGRADRPDRAQGGPRLGDGSHRHREGHQEPRRRPRSSPTGPSTKKANELYGKYYAIVAYPERQADAAQLSGRRREG